jgi:hypothetical protein
MHREGQILQAVQAAVEAVPDVGAAVFLHRTLSLSADDQELPAICINAGADEAIADSGYTNLAFIDSQCEVVVTLYAQAQTQQEVAAELDRLRVVVHKAMLAAPRTLGLTFLLGIAYGGADAPEYSTDGSPLAASRVCNFAVQYRMNLVDPE